MDVCDCGRFIEQPATGRRRSRCLICKPPRVRKRPEPPVGPAPAAASGATPAEGQTTAKIRAELVRLGQADTIPAVLALELARTADDPRLTPVQRAGLLEKLGKQLAPLLASAPVEADGLDEFTARLVERQRSA